MGAAAATASGWWSSARTASWRPELDVDVAAMGQARVQVRSARRYARVPVPLIPCSRSMPSPGATRAGAEAVLHADSG